MKKINKKMINVVTTAALVASLAAPLAVSAATDSRISEVPTFSDDSDSAKLATLTFQEDEKYPTDLQNGTITLTFPEGAKVKGLNVTGATYEIVGDYTVNLTVNAASTGQDKVEVTPTVELDGFSGSAVEVEVQSFGAGIPSGKYTLAKVAAGDAIVTALNTVTIGEANDQTLGAIRIEETAINKIKAGDEIKVKLPKGFTWDDATKVAPLGGLSKSLSTTGAAVTGYGTRTLTIKPTSIGTADVRGYLQITPVVDVDTKDASFGDVVVEVTGDKVASKDVTVGKYADYAVTVNSKGDQVELVSGRDADEKKDVELTKLEIKETVAGSITANRKTTVQFPKGVKIIGVEVKKDTNIKGDFQAELNKLVKALEASTADADDQRELEFTIPADKTDKKVELELLFKVSVQADFTGDIEATVSGRQGVEGKAVLGKAIAPVTATAGTTPKLVIGKKDQAIGDIVITEAKAGAILDGSGKELRVELPSDVEINKKGKVEVTDGNLELDVTDLTTVSSAVYGGKKNILVIKVDSKSTKVSTVKISGVTVDVDRSVPEGQIVAKVKGNAVVENSGKADDFGKFDASTVAKVAVAEVATPAPGTVYANANFTIDSTTYTVNGVEKTADVAPFIQDGRTFLPIRFVAEAVGVTESNVIWNANTKTVTLIKGDRIAQIQIGSKNLVVNGVSVPMDVAAFVKDGRTVLPLRYVAQALGAEVTWDEATRTVSVK
ncbi:copper amine oxidase N-terminal domain-containing protein [Ammoniphilus sp. 3BR4]|uniref:copper amine oxidase N-terminal domain-containing protein n=1 Tax=Ammoniphilus sp. 3BR4 TaxID=3158265 RepID=UPI0034667B08